MHYIELYTNDANQTDKEPSVKQVANQVHIKVEIWLDGEKITAEHDNMMEAAAFLKALEIRYKISKEDQACHQ